MDKKIAVVGGGITGLSCAAKLYNKDHDVTVFEKNAVLGGRGAKANQVLIEGHAEDSMELFEELGIKDKVIEPIDFDELGAVMDGGLKSFKPLTLFLKPEDNLSFVDKFIKRPFFSKVMGINTDQVIELKEEWENSMLTLDPLMNKIDELEKEIDAIVFSLYDLTEEEVVTVLDSLDTPEDEKNAILEKFREIRS